MPYNNAIPQPGDQLKNSQSQLLQNFQALQALIEVNHEIGTFDSPVVGDTGKHKFVNLTNQTAVGDVASAANQLSIFERVPAKATFGTQQNIFIVRDNSVSPNRRYIPLTSGTNGITAGQELYNVGNNNTIAFAFLGSGMCIKFGNLVAGAVPNNTTSSFTFNLNAIGPVFIALFHAQVSLSTDDSISLSGSGTAMVYVEWDTTTNSSLEVIVINRSGAALPTNTRVYFTTIGQVDLTST